MDSQIFWPQLGEFLKSIALTASLFAIFAGLWALRTKDERWFAVAGRSIYLCFVMTTGAIATLSYCFLSDNFLVKYVYSYSNIAMPTVYKFSALWGGQDGSLLFWMWLLSAYSALAVYFHRDTDRPLIPGMTACLGVIISFFGCLILFSDNPFELFPGGISPTDGRGLNPLLQNPSMAIHPPSLYLGYVGMSIPFAFAIGALLSGHLGVRWVVASRLWTLIAWFFLSVGNLLGSQWAYVELGWGGFWGWDPVENAAILPWFTASAFLHSVMIQEKRGMLKFWNMSLIVITFALTILGTYLTRSGVVQSVHSFASSDIGYFFLIFLILVLLFSAALIYWRRNQLRTENIFESFLSKESAFVVNNIVLVGSAFIILWATLFPSASELIIGKRILVGPPFYNKILAPLGIVLLVLTGIGPVIGWRKASKKNIKSNFVWPTLLGGLSALGCILLGLWEWYVILTAFGVVFVMTTLIVEFYRGGKARVVAQGEGWAQAILTAMWKNKRKYGGYIVHVGLVLIFIGIAGAVYKSVHEFDMKPGDRARFHEYEIHFKGFDQRQVRIPADGPVHRDELYALVDLYQNGKLVREMKPARFAYRNPPQPSTEVDIHSRVKEDVYFIFSAGSNQDNMAKIRVILQPFIFFLWGGGFVLVLGALLSMMPGFGFNMQNREFQKKVKDAA